MNTGASNANAEIAWQSRRTGGCVRSLLWAGFLLIMFAEFAASAGTLSTKEVTNTGSGPTLQQAINSGLLTAIQEVNGTTLAQANVFASLQASAETQNDSAYLSSEAYLSAVAQATQGAVTGFKILSYKHNPDGSWLVNVKATVTVYKRSAEEQRTSIVVAIPHGQVDNYNVFGRRAAARSVATDLAEQVQTFLVSTNKFTVLDRDHDAAVDQELGIAESSQASTGQFAMVGQKIAAQYILVSSIEHLSYYDIHTQSRTGDHVYTRPVGGMSVRYQLISSATQQVVLSRIARVDLAGLGLSGGASPQTVLAGSVRAIAKKEGAAVLHSLFPIRILAIDNESYIIGAGEDVLAIGQIYEVMTYGPAVIDPDTHESVGRVENYCCEIHITRVAPKLSYGTLLPPIKALANFSPERYILGQRVIERQAHHSRAGANAMKALKEEIKKQQQAAGGSGTGPS